ncbi:O-antigen ligase family protein [Cryobacterium sp. MDB1-18-2]|uniref:O-antigen ligase family protein n=1 Tax=unclassified Cryobacterium TaxID=2649013 RepID=UPI00106D1385|nr:MULTISPECIES: O-antigen ligase family protein [unclassified Cryobacterium]MEB0001326.1 O-antigen ligase family protein [Cryobacterium sp. RTC2.1]MEB0303960.1 O-antigen ligase family protein [Cryobacterium sp. 10I1]TFC09818.1 O-antigen ligase family protein [Cryobacterium sp. MDB2-33-2]TFC24203.1 O-antigen ligase family protein [Cryobacterium sp. MDB1-18-2]TFC43125.1 O-antigen ligase family protein [Cryobacterium sp. MDB1-18-1]
MNSRAHSPELPRALMRLFRGPHFATALTQATIATAFGSVFLRGLVGWPGLIGVLGGLVVLAAFSLVARRKQIEWHGLLPISILVFLGWCALSLLWTGYPFATAIGLIYQLAFAFLALYIVLARTMIQIVRATGDVLRVLLATSVALEIVAGLLLDAPIRFLDIQGHLDELGPIQGIFGSRNALGFAALIAGVTFVIELRTRSVRRGVAIVSLIGATACLLLTGSPVIFIVAVFVGLAGLALTWLRNTPQPRRRLLQFALLGVTVVAGVVAFLTRGAIVEALNARSEFGVRATLWREMWRLVGLHPLEGWGWSGLWPGTATPYGWLDFSTRRHYETGLNAFLDVYFQLGLIGFLSFLVLVVLAFWRSWVLASNKRTLIYAWAPLILVVLIVTSLAESTVLVEAGWLLLLICALTAAQGKSWRSGLQPRPRPPETDDGAE